MISFGVKKERVDYVKREGAYGVISDPVKGFGVILFDHTHFLVGGGMEKDETPIACLNREFREEIGYEVLAYEYIDTYREFHQSIRSATYYELIGKVYKVVLGEKLDVKTEEDHVLVWIKPDDLEGKMQLVYQSYVLESLTD